MRDKEAENGAKNSEQTVGRGYSRCAVCSRARRRCRLVLPGRFVATASSSMSYSWSRRCRLFGRQTGNAQVITGQQKVITGQLGLQKVATGQLMPQKVTRGQLEPARVGRVNQGHQRSVKDITGIKPA